MTPDAPGFYLPDADYLRLLCKAAGLSPRQAAKQIGISERAMRYFLTPALPGADFRVAPYPVQFALETLACTHPSYTGLGSFTYTNADVALECFEVIAYLIEQIEQALLAPPGPDLAGVIDKASRVVRLSEVVRRLVQQMGAAHYFDAPTRDKLLERINAAEQLRRERLPQ